MGKRIALFLATNILVVLTISILTSVLGIRPYLQANGLDYGSLAAFCLLWGMGGAFISLALSRVMAKMAMGVKVIDPGTVEPAPRQLLQMVEELARGANIPMPQVGVYDSPDINAFATGPMKSRSLVAVSSGLLQKMDRGEVHGVLSHEIAHIANGDMVTMALLQGVVNAFVMFLARAVAFAVVQAVRRDDGEGISRGIYFVTVIALELVFMILGSIVVAWFSRRREFRADAGGAQYGGRENMVRALEALRRDVENVPVHAKPALATMQISNPGRVGMLFASHPPLEERIARLRSGAAA